jgi:hypothetical protein
MPMIQNFGYTPNPEETEAFVQSLPPAYAKQAQALADDDTDDGADALNYRLLAAMFPKGSPWLNDDGQLVSLNQNPAGTCVGFGTAIAEDVLAACDIAMRREPEEWVARFSPDAAYAISRHISGHLGRGDGSYGGAAAKGIREWGTVHQLVYGDIDLTKYDYKRTREWALRGVPESIRTAAGPHKIRHTVQLETVEQAWGLVGNGYPYNMCSNVGWESKRDADGACRRRGSWSHSMGVTSRRTTASGRRLFLVHQSWGDNWTSGPYYEDQPFGSFWADWEDIDRAIRQGDSFAYSGYEGFVRRRPDHRVLL